MAHIQEQRREHLVIVRAQALAEVAAGDGRVGQLLAALQIRGQVAAADFQRAGHPAGAGRPQPRQGDQFPGRTVEQPSQWPVVREQVAGGGDRIAPAQAGTEEQRQQFGVGERGGAAGEELFTGPFVDGPVSDVHMAKMPGPPPRRHQAGGDHRVS